jgi:hypothetical protein
MLSMLGTFIEMALLAPAPSLKQSVDVIALSTLLSHVFEKSIINKKYF